MMTNDNPAFFYSRLQQKCTRISARLSKQLINGSSKVSQISALLASNKQNKGLNDLSLTLLTMMQLKYVFNQHRLPHNKLFLFFKPPTKSGKHFQKYAVGFLNGLSATFNDIKSESTLSFQEKGADTIINDLKLYFQKSRASFQKTKHAGWLQKLASITGTINYAGLNNPNRYGDHEEDESSDDLLRKSYKKNVLSSQQSSKGKNKNNFILTK